MADSNVDGGDPFDRLLLSSNVNSPKGKSSLKTLNELKYDPEDSDSEDEITRTAHSKKPVFDDSSDDESPVTFKKSLIVPTDDDEYANKAVSGDEEIGVKSKTGIRTKKLLDDSDDDLSVTSPSRNATTHSSQPNILTRSDEEHSDSDGSLKSRRSSRSSKSEASGTSSSGSSDGEENSEEVSIQAIKSKIMNQHRLTTSKLLNEPESEDPEKIGKRKPVKEKAPSRKAKEAALAEIHSETQRMTRERQISLPYHKPKQRSLADYLNRRKLAPTVRLKTTSDELAKVWKHAEEREKTAELFYKSESDEECDERGSNQVEGDSQQNTSIAHEKRNEEVPGISDSKTDSQSLIASTQPPESEEFRLQLSEILVDSCELDEYRSLKINANAVEGGDLKDNNLSVEEKDTSGIDVPDSKTEAALDAVDSMAVSDSEPLSHSENTFRSNILEESNSFSCLSEKINSLNLPIAKCPKISGAPDEVIDLDELTTKPGAFGLMQRFLKHVKLKPKVKQQNVISIMSSEVNDLGEIINVSEESIRVRKKDEQKPGERLTVLKTTLQQKIAENREQQLAKKIEEYKLYEDEFYGVDKTSDNEEEEELMSENDGSDEKKCKAINDEDRDIDNPFLEVEADESDEDQADDNVEDEIEEQDNDDMSDAEESTSILLGGGSDDEPEVDEGSKAKTISENDEDEDIILIPPVSSEFHSLVGTQSSQSIHESQLMALCSGNFSSATLDLKNLETSSEAFQSPNDKGAGRGISQQRVEDDSDNEEILTSKKSNHKRNRKLSFSDDEDDTKNTPDTGLAGIEDDDNTESALNDVADSDQENDVEGEGELSEEDHDPVVEEDEDDEEVQLAKKLSKGFLDKEAELSESEWGSEDEDEKGMDQYEEEEGDNERISQRRLRKELGKIHMREVLADDNREIRILQELLLEDGDLHSDGPKRQRLFRWYNQDDDNPGEKRSLDFGEKANDNNEDDDEESWRKQRLERENYLRKKKIDNMELEIVDSPVNFNDTRRGVKVIPKVVPPTNTSPDVKSQFSIFSKRGSFLGRGEKMLSKLAEITNNTGSKENAMGNTRNNRNMVFSIVSPPKEKQGETQQEMPLKRKGNFIATSVVKKIKFSTGNTTTKVSALDQLKLFEST